MSTNDTHHDTHHDASDIDDATTRLPDIDVPMSAVSRRTLMKTAAGTGVAVATVGLVGVASAATTSDASSSDAIAAGRLSAAELSKMAGPVVVHVTDFAKGTLEVFNGWSHTQITDTDLAARIARAAH